MKYVKRSIESKLLSSIHHFPAALLTGSRQSGKSTLLKHLLPSYRYLTLDHLATRRLATDDPELLLSSNPTPLIIDEIQYAPSLLSYIKIAIDEDRHSYGRFVLTGSQVFSLMSGVTESLAGRICIYELYPLTWMELPDFELIKHDDIKVFNRIASGFYPELLHLPEQEASPWLDAYLRTYIERDVRNVKAITDITRFQTFLYLLAARAGNLLNLSEVAKECGITMPTAKDWLTILESTYIVHILRPLHANITKRMVKHPKLYFVDTGILCHLLGIENGEQLLKSPMRGAIFENQIIMDRIKSSALKSSRTRFSFYRTASGVEVDLIEERGSQISAFEIKCSKTPNREMAGSLLQFKKEYPEAETSLLCLREHSLPLYEGIEAMHWSLPLEAKLL